MRLAFQDSTGVRFVDPLQVASLVPAWPNRVRLVLADGSVGYRPAPLPSGPWVKLGEALVNPTLLRRQGDEWLDPADFRFPYQPLPPAPHAGLDSRLAHSIQYLQWRDERTFWQTDEGEVPSELSIKQAGQVYPELVFASKTVLVNPARIERIHSRAMLVLDTGRSFRLNTPRKTARSLGIASVHQLDPDFPASGACLREYPVELASAPVEWLRAQFDSYYTLMKNLTWQAGCYHREGRVTDYGTDQAGFWQHPIASTLKRLGWPSQREARTRFNHLIREMVVEHRLVTLEGLNFRDPGAQARAIGQRSPEVILYSHHPEGRQIARELGLSFLQSDEKPSLAHTEWLARDLRAVHRGPVILLAWVGFGPGGWQAVELVQKDLERYGFSSGVAGYLLRPECLTPEERAAARELPLTSQNKLWLDQSGGVDGRAAELPAAALLPTDRVRERVLQQLRQPVQAPPSFPDPDPHSWLPLEDETGLLFCPLQEVATLTPAPPERWRVVTSTGKVAYRPQPPGDGPWVPLSEALAAPGWLRREREQWVDPADFRFPPAQLEAPPKPPVLTENWPGLPCPASQILSLQAGPPRWLTDAGEVAADQPVEIARRLHPALIQVDSKTYINRHRLRRLDYGRPGHWVLLFDNGFQWKFSSHVAEQLAAGLGLPNLYHLQPHREELDGLREYAYELARAPATRLRADFRTPRQLIRNMIWQTFCYRRQGLPVIYGDSYRGYWYVPMCDALRRAGFLDRRAMAWHPPEDDQKCHELTRGSGIYSAYQRALHEFVGKYRLFTFQQFGFKDARPRQRHIGRTHPEVIVVAEKGGQIEEYLKVLGDQLGVSTIWFRGQPSLLDMEYLVADLRRVYTGPILVIAYTDHDPPGQIIGAAAQEQLKFLGMNCPNPVRYLVVPELFSAEEIELYAYKLPANNASEKALLENWLRQTGGIDGQPRGLHANDLVPLERVLERCRHLLEQA